MSLIASSNPLAKFHTQNSSHNVSSRVSACTIHKSEGAHSSQVVGRKIGNCYRRLSRCVYPLGYFLQNGTQTKRSGIGAAIARNLASKGASLVLGFTSDSSAEPSRKLASTLENEHGINVLAVQADMGNPKGPAYLVTTAKNHFSHPRTGKFQIDIVINNAGVSHSTPLVEVTAEDFQHQYAVNVMGPILLMQAALPYLPHNRSGRVVNLSSVSSSQGFIGQTIYGGTKAALEAMTRTWARELAERATVNAVNPGPVATDMYGATSEAFQLRMKPFTQTAPLAALREGIDEQRFIDNVDIAGGRPAYDHEIAGVVAMLCSEDAGWSTGSVVCANGGLVFSR